MPCIIILYYCDDWYGNDLDFHTKYSTPLGGTILNNKPSLRGLVRSAVFYVSIALFVHHYCSFWPFFKKQFFHIVWFLSDVFAHRLFVLPYVKLLYIIYASNSILIFNNRTALDLEYLKRKLFTTTTISLKLNTYNIKFFKYCTGA